MSFFFSPESWLQTLTRACSVRGVIKLFFFFLSPSRLMYLFELSSSSSSPGARASRSTQGGSGRLLFSFTTTSKVTASSLQIGEYTYYNGEISRLTRSLVLHVVHSECFVTTHASHREQHAWTSEEPTYTGLMRAT